MLFRLWILALVVLLGACAHLAPQRGADQQAAETDSATDLIDPNIPPGVAGRDGWNFHRDAEADLNGDGRAERIVLAARVEWYRGRPAWDDGHPWQVYVETANGQRTYLYSRRLQLGTLTMRISHSEPGEPASIILIEHLPDRLSLYEAYYEQPGQVSTITRFKRRLDPRGDLASPQLP